MDKWTVLHNGHKGAGGRPVNDLMSQCTENITSIGPAVMFSR